MAGRPNSSPQVVRPVLCVEVIDLGARQVQPTLKVRLNPGIDEKGLLSGLLEYEHVLGHTALQFVVDNAIAGCEVMNQVSGLCSPIPTWMESCTELICLEGQWASRRCYVGGRVPFVSGLPPFPLGAVGDSVGDAWQAFAAHHSRFRRLHRQLNQDLAPLDSTCASLSLDGYSAGVFAHEAIGHPSEEDNRLAMPGHSVLTELDVVDLPCSAWGMNYEVSDTGARGRPVPLNLTSPSLTVASGNAFFGISQGHTHLLVRQRNLSISGRVSDSGRGVRRNSVLVYGAVSYRDVTLEMLCLLNADEQLRTVVIRVAPNMLESISANGMPAVMNASICMKKRCSHVIGLSSVGLSIDFRSPVLGLILDRLEGH